MYFRFFLNIVIFISLFLAFVKGQGLYKVKPGDTLYKICREYNLTIKELIDANNISNPDDIKVGTVLVVPFNYYHYKVNKGDTLCGIANKFKITVSALKEINSLDNDKIKVNQILLIPFSSLERLPFGGEKEIEASLKQAIVIEPVASLKKTASREAETITQVLFGEKVGIREAQNNWLRVRVKDGYLGWIESKSLESPLPKQIEELEVMKVAALWLEIKVAPDSASSPLFRIPLGSRVYVTDTNGGWREVWLPNYKKGWVPANQLLPLNYHSENKEEIIKVALAFKGTPYLWGGTSPLGVDCSGFVYTICDFFGIKVPRDADQQWQFLPRQEGAPDVGDLVFFSTYRAGASHVGFYIGEDKFLHASSSRGVIITSLKEPYFKERFLGFRKLPLGETFTPVRWHRKELKSVDFQNIHTQDYKK